LRAPTGRPGCGDVPQRRDCAPNRAQTRTIHQPPGFVEVNSISFLPATFTTLFFLAASLLLGLIR